MSHVSLRARNKWTMLDFWILTWLWRSNRWNSLKYRRAWWRKVEPGVTAVCWLMSTISFFLNKQKEKGQTYLRKQKTTLKSKLFWKKLMWNAALSIHVLVKKKSAIHHYITDVLPHYSRQMVCAKLAFSFSFSFPLLKRGINVDMYKREGRQMPPAL